MSKGVMDPASLPSSTEEPFVGAKTDIGPKRFREITSRMSLLGIWIVLAGVFAIIEPSTFLQSGTFKTIFGTQFELVLLSVALICTFVVGEFDLSVASIMGLAGTLVPVLAVQQGWPLWIATICAIAAAGAVGVLNGLLVVVAGVDAIVVTLGMGTFILGVTLWMTNLNAVSGLSASFSQLADRDVFGLPIAVFYAVAACLILAYVLQMTPLGRRMAFVGSSREVARLAGINVNRIRFGSYVAGALICGIAGVLLSSSLGSYDPNTSPTYLLPAFAAVFLGTAVIRPGKFNPIGALIAVYFLQTGVVGLELAGLTGWVPDVFYGGALVLAVAVTTILQRITAT